MLPEIDSQAERARTGIGEPFPVDSGPTPASGNGLAAPPVRRRGFRARLAAFRARLVSPESPLLVYLGVFSMVGGFGAIAYTWGEVAGVLSVPIQLPYLVSGGFAGLGVVAVGIALVNIGTKRRDAAAREHRLRKLSSSLESIAVALAESSESDKEDREHGRR